MPAPGSALSPLTHPPFVGIWLAMLATTFANQVQIVSVTWAITLSDGRADRIALVQTAAMLPFVAFSLVGGAVADSGNRRLIMLVTQLSGALFTAILVLAAWNGFSTTWLLLALVFASGSAHAFFNPAVQAGIGEAVPRTELPGAIGLHIVGFNMARFAGPALGGLVVSLGGVAAGYVVSALGSAMSALAAWTLGPRTPPSAAPQQPMIAAIMQGLRQMVAISALRRSAIRNFSFTLCGTAIWALTALVARDLVEGGAATFGSLLGALGLGAAIGAFFGHGMRRRLQPETVVRYASVAFGAAIFIVALAPGKWATFALLFVAGAMWVQALSVLSVTAQLWAPPNSLGRVASAMGVMLWGGFALGSWIWGLLATRFPVTVVLAASGIATALSVLPAIAYPLPPRHSDQDVREDRQ